MYLESLKIRAGIGMPVTVFGGVFDDLSKVYIDGVSHHVTDISATSLTFTAPLFVREYSCRIVNVVTSEEVAFTLVVVPIEDMGTYRIADRAAAEFEEMQVGLMPRGFALDLLKGSYIRTLIDAIALCILYIYNLLKTLVCESSPATSTALGLWENELGLPKNGLVQTTENGRRKEIMRVARGAAGGTLNYLRSILDLYGADYNIYEYWNASEYFPGWVQALDQNENVFYVMIKVYRKEVRGSFGCNSKCSSKLGSDHDTILEALLNSEKLAHIRLVFSYYCRILTDENENAIRDDDSGKLIIASF